MTEYIVVIGTRERRVRAETVDIEAPESLATPMLRFYGPKPDDGSEAPLLGAFVVWDAVLVATPTRRALVVRKPVAGRVGTRRPQGRR